MENEERLCADGTEEAENESAADGENLSAPDTVTGNVCDNAVGIVTSIKKFSEAEMAAARASWEAETAQRVAALEASLAAEKRARVRRETEIRCAGFLRERALDESLCGMILGESETEVADETLLLRVEALSGAVEAAAIRLLRGRAGEGRPRAGDGVPLGREMIRDLPISRLSELMQNP